MEKKKMPKEFHKACNDNEIEENSFKFLWVRRKPVIVSNKDGEYQAFSGLCTHDSGIMEDAGCEGHEIICKRHGARFDMGSGDATRMPATFGLAKYDLKIEDGEIFIFI
jgi:3-phenylpropionate/trans-cinnamate dioxygenase ferredoxin component